MAAKARSGVSFVSTARLSNSCKWVLVEGGADGSCSVLNGSSDCFGKAELGVSFKSKRKQFNKLRNYYVLGAYGP